MLKITADIFSGRPNPVWIIGKDEAQKILKQISANTDTIEYPDPSLPGLGYRGLILELISEDLPQDLKLPAGFRISNTSAAGMEISASIIELMTSRTQHMDLGGAGLADVQRILKAENSVLRARLPSLRTVSPMHMLEMSKTLKYWIKFLQKGGCTHEEIAFDPGFWNDPAHRTQNNCYNFATNRRTDTFAQPGRASGQMYTSIDCAAVKAAAIRDGAVQAPPCPPDAQAPRYWVALVIAPGWPDFHWYRRCSEGYWAHKPGGTPAKNTDNAGVIIMDPETCDRGPYTQFCGYLYTQNTMVVS